MNHPWEQNFLIKILIKIYKFSLKRMHFKMSYIKCQPCCSGLNVLRKENIFLQVFYIILGLLQGQRKIRTWLSRIINIMHVDGLIRQSFQQDQNITVTLHGCHGVQIIAQVDFLLHRLVRLTTWYKSSKSVLLVLCKKNLPVTPNGFPPQMTCDCISMFRSSSWYWSHCW